jgi:hypothetical protein
VDATVFVARIAAAADRSGPKIDAVLNLASLTGGPVAPGELIRITGAGFTEDTALFVDGRPVQVLESSAAGLPVSRLTACSARVASA